MARLKAVLGYHVDVVSSIMSVLVVEELHELDGDLQLAARSATRSITAAAAAFASPRVPAIVALVALLLITSRDPGHQAPPGWVRSTAHSRVVH